MDYRDILISLDHHEAINTLLALCSDDEQIRDKVLDLATKRLQDIDVEEVAEHVFNTLSGIDVRELWNRSGKTYCGYNDPSEESGIMVEEAIESFVQRLNDFRRLGMKKEEEAYCQAICAGLLQYDSNGANEFHDWAVDDPGIIADNLYYDWKKENQKDKWTALYAKEAHNL